MEENRMNENHVNTNQINENQTNVNQVKGNQVRETKFNKLFRHLSGLISLVTAILPILLYIICVVLSHGEGEDGDGAIGWLLVLYLWFAAIPVFLISVVTGIYGIKGKTKILAVLGLLVDIALVGLIMYFMIQIG